MKYVYVSIVCCVLADYGPTHREDAPSLLQHSLLAWTVSPNKQRWVTLVLCCMTLRNRIILESQNFTQISQIYADLQNPNKLQLTFKIASPT